MGVQGLGFRVQGLGFRVQGLGFRLQGLGLTWTPKVCKNNGLYGHNYGFRAIILHTFGV